MLRGLFTILAGASLVLCAATCVLWVRSYFVCFEVVRWSVDPERRLAVTHELLATNGIFSLNRGTWAYETEGGFRLFEERLSTAGAAWSLRTYGRKNLVSPDTVLGQLGFFHGTAHYTKQATRLRPVRADLGTFTVDEMAVAWPMWLVACVLLLPLLPFATRLLRRWGRGEVIGRCHACGYDLRATPGRCPECGAVPAGHLAFIEARNSS